MKTLMANYCGIGEFSCVEVEEDDIELSLGLSIGGSFRKLEKLKPIKQKLPRSPSMNDDKSDEIDIDLEENGRSFCKTIVSPIFDAGVCSEEDKELNDGAGTVDSQRKREIHALGRQETRKKREEKRQKKGICSERNGSSIPMRTGSMDDKMLFEAQVFQCMVQDRGKKESEANQSERNCKKDKSENEGSSNERQSTNLTLKNSKTLNQNPNNSNPDAFSSPSFPVVPVQYPFHHFQCVPFGNGFAFPYVIPCLGHPSTVTGGDNGVFQPLVRRSFQPFQVQDSNSRSSSGRSSSATSNHRSTSLQGESSSDTRSHSSNSLTEQPQNHGSVASNAQGQSEHTDSSYPGRRTHNNGVKVVSSNKAQSIPKKSEEPVSVNEPITINKYMSNTENLSSEPTLPPLMEAKGGRKKPPRPRPHHRQTISPFPRIPCVTKGNGPNGKTITGFLYKYTKTEVSIMCSCHGRSFSPSEFVEHAGGTDILNPLRHIVVVQSDLR